MLLSLRSIFPVSPVLTDAPLDDEPPVLTEVTTSTLLPPGVTVAAPPVTLRSARCWVELKLIAACPAAPFRLTERFAPPGPGAPASLYILTVPYTTERSDPDG